MHKTIVKYIKGYVTRNGRSMDAETLAVRFTQDKQGVESISIAIERGQDPVVLTVPFQPVERMVEESRRK